MREKADEHDGWAYVVAATAGAAGWLGVARLTGRHEAWDSALYFSWLLPSIWTGCGALGFFAPDRPWRWGFAAFGAQALVMWIQNPTGSLLPLGLILFAVFGAIAAVPSWLGMRLRRWTDGAS